MKGVFLFKLFIFMSKLDSHELVVAKAGTNVLTYKPPGRPSARLDNNTLQNLADDVSSVMESTGLGVILVSSGAIGAGNELTNWRRNLKDVPDEHVKQALAAIGQPRLTAKWADAFEGALPPRLVAQILLTQNNLADDRERKHLFNALRVLLDQRVVPIANENDVVSVDEIKENRIIETDVAGGEKKINGGKSKFGDNDQLATQLAKTTGAKILALLTDVKGICDKDPSKYDDAKLFERLKASEMDEDFFGRIGASGNENGTGGPGSKARAAKSAAESGMIAVIADGKVPGVLGKIVKGEKIGTWIYPE